MGRGFTLIELVMVLVLTSILAVAVWPRAPSSDSLTLRGRAEQLASDIRYAQTLSMTLGSRFCVVVTASTYQLRTTAVNACSATAEPNPAGLGATQPIDICSNCMSNSGFAGTLIFDGKGVPYTDATTPLGGTATINIAGDGGPRTVLISPETGRVVVQ